MDHQDWNPVVLSKNRPRGAGGARSAATKHDINEAQRRGDVTREKKITQSNAHVNPNYQKAWKVDNETEVFRHNHVSNDFKAALQKARLDKKMTQAQLAQMINEKPSVVNEYESGKAIPNGAIINKLNRALGCTLPKAAKK